MGFFVGLVSLGLFFFYKLVGEYLVVSGFRVTHRIAGHRTSRSKASSSLIPVSRIVVWLEYIVRFSSSSFSVPVLWGLMLV